MREWHIQSSTISTTLLIEQVTILKGSIKDWRERLITLQSYFDHRQTNIILKEDQTLVSKQDYNFSSISFSNLFDSTDLLKIKRQLKQQFLTQLQLSPFYKQLVEVWDDLIEEIEFLNSTPSSVSYDFELLPFKDKIVSDQLTSDEIGTLNLNTLQDLIKAIKLIEEASKDKLNIISIVYPETILTTGELEQFIRYLKSHSIYTQFILLTDHSSILGDNILYKNQVVSKLLFNNIRPLLIDILPFEFEEEVFTQAVNWSMSLVDKYPNETIVLSYSSVDNFKKFIYAFTLLILTKTPFILDAAMIPAPYDKYIAKLLGETV